MLGPAAITANANGILRIRSHPRQDCRGSRHQCTTQDIPTEISVAIAAPTGEQRVDALLERSDIAYNKLGRADEAEEVLREALELEPSDVRSWLTLAKLQQEQEALAYQFRLDKETSEAERKRIAANGEAAANKIINSSLTSALLRMRGIEATIRLSESPNSKVVIIGSGSDGMPLILGNN